jgi:hypothetical protein
MICFFLIQNCPCLRGKHDNNPAPQFAVETAEKPLFFVIARVDFVNPWQSRNLRDPTSPQEKIEHKCTRTQVRKSISCGHIHLYVIIYVITSPLEHGTLFHLSLRVPLFSGTWRSRNLRDN